MQQQQQNTELPDSRTRGPAAPTVLVAIYLYLQDNLDTVAVAAAAAVVVGILSYM